MKGARAVRKCRYCHAEIQDASRVCEHCGKDLVSVPAPADPEYGKALPVAPDPDLSTALVQRVAVVDLAMPFGSMVLFMFKWMLASIPAFIMFVALFMVLGFLFGGLFSTCKIPGVPR